MCCDSVFAFEAVALCEDASATFRVSTALLNTWLGHVRVLLVACGLARQHGGGRLWCRSAEVCGEMGCFECYDIYCERCESKDAAGGHRSKSGEVCSMCGFSQHGSQAIRRRQDHRRNLFAHTSCDVLPAVEVAWD